MYMTPSITATMYSIGHGNKIDKKKKSHKSIQGSRILC